MRRISREAGAVLAAMLAILFATPATAETAGLECMAASYDAEEQATLERLSLDYGVGADHQGNEAAGQLAKLAGAEAKECGDRAGWGQEELVYAALFEIGRVGENAIRHSAMFTPDQLQKIDAALAKGDRGTLWAGVERSVWAGMMKKDADGTPQDTFAMGAFLMGVGIGADDAVGEKTGMLLGMMALQRIGQREFLALRKGE